MREIDLIIDENESQVVEWKESWQDKYLEWICGYANAQGGTLYIGIDDNGNVLGLEEKVVKKLLEDIPNKITAAFGMTCDVNLRTKDKKKYSSAGRAFALQAKGHRFEPCCSHHNMAR